MNTTNVMIAGDTHGNVGWWRTLTKLARRHRLAHIIQLGDFGLWPDPSGRLDVRYVSTVSRLCEAAGVSCWFIDGNHDFVDAARQLWPPDDDGVRHLSASLRWADRGSRFTIAGVRFAALGGAVSIDRADRKLDKNWWLSENPTSADLQRLGDTKADVLLTHEAPSGLARGKSVSDMALQAEMDDSRRLLSVAVDRTRPDLLLHGHYHRRHSDTLERGELSVRVEGLGADINGDGRAWGVLELPTLQFVDGFAYLAGPGRRGPSGLGVS